MFVDFLDELGSGVTPVSAGEIRDELGLSHSALSLVLLTAPFVIALVVEGPLLLRSDRWRRERAAAICVAIMGLAMLGAAWAPTAWALALALAAWGSAGGVGCGVSQGALMDAYPEARERWMTRWTFMGSLGDVATPLLIVLVAALGYGWREALTIAGVLHLVHALVLSRVSLGDDDREDERRAGDDAPDEGEPTRWWRRLRAGLGDRELMTWLGASALCCFLDEILVAFGALFMRDELGMSLEQQGLAFTIGSLGGVLGLAISDRLLARVDPLRLLGLASLACALAYAAWLQATTPVASVIALGLVGVFVAPLYPICAARAYAARPDQPGLVAAIDQLYAPVPLLAPLVIGLIADARGLTAALAVLAVQPVGILVIVVSRRLTRGHAQR